VDLQNHEENNNNKRNNIKIKFRNKYRSFMEMCKIFNIDINKARSRRQRGWGVIKIFTA